MKLDDRYYCFGCGATGCAVDLTARLLDLSPKEAVLQLASDFGIQVPEKLPWHPLFCEALDKQIYVEYS